MTAAGQAGRPPMIQPGATVDPTARLAPDTHLGAHSRIGPGVVVGSGSHLGDHVVVESGAEIGERVTIGSGAFLHAGLVIGDDVVIGPNAAFVSSTFDPAGARHEHTIVREGAAVGANSTVLSGTTIGRRAVVGAGTVVTSDVPPFATVVGSPARITGYVASPRFIAARSVRASSLADEDFPFTIGRVTVNRLRLIEDLRGSLVVGECPEELPFLPQRVFTVFDVKSRKVRGEHAHHRLEELLICVHGELALAVDDGTERGEIVLDRPDVVLHLPPLVWSTQYKYSPDGVLLVLASTPYDPEGYIRDFDEFQRLTSHG